MLFPPTSLVLKSRSISARALRLAVAGVFATSILSAGLLGGQSVASAQASRPSRPALITQAVDETNRVTLKGGTSPLATHTADRGAAPESMPANRMLLLLKRSPERESELRTQIEALHDANSPSFHQWLTPAQFGEEWGAADSDIATITAWLQSHGFEVAGATAGKTAIEFSGTAGQIEEAFHTSIHLYELKGEIHHANASDPQIPSALASVVAGIATLNDFHPHALSKKGPRGIYDASTHTVRPDLTSSGGGENFLYVGPADAATIYNSPNHALNPTASGTTYDGTGVKIGILGDSNISLIQNANYRKLFGLTANTPTVIIDGATDPGENGDAVEAYLDTEVANGIAPGSKVYLYTAADTATDFGLNLATARAVNDNIVDVLSVSFGQCEAGLAYPGNQFFASMWEQAAAQGISVTVSSGDSGSAGCDDENTETSASYGLQVNGIASTQFDIAVGGTDFAALAGPDGYGANFKNYVSTSNAVGTLRSAKEYIPEVPWNNTFLNFPPGPLSGSKAAPSPNANIVSAGGGKSNCSQGYVGGNGDPYCIAGYLKPSWQSAPGVPADGARDIPDVSLFSANGLYYAAWGICTDQDADSNGHKLSDCTPGSNGLPANEFYIYGVGGTSASAPAFAGILALVDQKYGRQGQADYVLYHLARSRSGIFHDVTTGNNSVPCQGGTENCQKNSAGSYYLSGYDAAAGFDLASGLGSVNASNLVSEWESIGLTSTRTSLKLTPTSIQHGEIVDADASVMPMHGATPTGDIALSAYANPPSLPYGSAIGTFPLLSDGSTGSVPINHLPGGTYKVIATYGGSPELTESVSAPITVTVTPESSTTAITVSAYNPANSSLSTTIQYGYFLGITAHPYGNRSPIVDGVVQPDGTATGKVTFAANGKALETFNLDSRALATYSIQENNMLNAGKYSITATYPGDNSLLPSVGTQVLEIAKAPTHITMSANGDAYDGHPLTFKVKLSSDSAGLAPTGMVALKHGSTVLAEVSLLGVGAMDSVLASGIATITTGDLPIGTNDLVAVYEGDLNYGASVSNGLEIKGRPYFTIASTSVTIPSEHSSAAPYMVTTSVGGYSGTIKYTCALIGKNTETSPPECAMYPASSEALTAGGTISPQVLIFGKGTKLPTGITIGSADTKSDPKAGFGSKLGIGIGATALACCFLFGIPARRKGWKTILSVLLLLGAVSSFTACGSNGKFTSSGQYVFQVVGTDSVDSTNTATATLKVTIY